MARLGLGEQPLLQPLELLGDAAVEHRAADAGDDAADDRGIDFFGERDGAAGRPAERRHQRGAAIVGERRGSDDLGGHHDALEPAARALGMNPWAWILGGGEDHALVATFAPDAVPDGWRAIGRVLDGPGRVLVDGETWSGDTGWQSF